jgi:sugar lactone lactonase YvrE
VLGALVLAGPLGACSATSSTPTTSTPTTSTPTTSGPTTSTPTTSTPTTSTPTTSTPTTSGPTTTRPQPRLEVALDLGEPVARTGRIEVLTAPGDPFGDGGPVEEAVIGELAGVAVGLNGAIALADRSLGRIRVIGPDGTIRTVAGGRPGRVGSGRVGRVGPLAVDDAGRVFAVDTGDDRIVAVEDGSVREVLAPAGLVDPRTVAVTAEGTLLVADARVGLVSVRTDGTDRRVLEVPGIRSPVAALELAPGLLAVAGGDEVVLVRVDDPSAPPLVVARRGRTGLGAAPVALARRASGLLVAAGDGTFTLIPLTDGRPGPAAPPTGSAPPAPPGEVVALADAGPVALVLRRAAGTTVLTARPDPAGPTDRPGEITIATGRRPGPTPAGGAVLRRPGDTARLDDGTTVIPDEATDLLWHIDGDLATPLSPDAPIARPAWTLALGDTRLLVGQRGGRVVEIDPATGRTRPWGPADLTAGPMALSNGQVVVVDGRGGRLTRLDDRGRSRASTTISALVDPLDLAVTPAGDTLVLDRATLALLRIRPDGTVSAVAIGVGDRAGGVIPLPLDRAVERERTAVDLRGGPLSVPAGVGVTPGGDVVLTDGATRRLVRLADGALRPVVSRPVASPAALRWSIPGAVTVTPDGTLLVADGPDGGVRELTPDGGNRRLAGALRGDPGGDGPPTRVDLRGAGGIAVTADGTIVVADTAHHRIRQLRDGRWSTLAGTGTPGADPGDGSAVTAQLESPAGVALTPSGDVLIADTGNNRIVRIDGTGLLSVVVGVGRAGRADRSGATGADGTPPTGLSAPLGVAGTADGRTVIADTGAGRVIVTLGDGRIEVVARTARPDAAVLDPDEVTLTASAQTDQVVATGPYGSARLVAGRGGEGDDGDGGPAAAARLRDPVDLARAPDGTLYIAERGGGRLRRITPDGRIDTVAGVPGISAVAVAPDGTVVAIDAVGRILRWTAP